MLGLLVGAAFLGSGPLGTARFQQRFPDSPENHPTYEAVYRLRKYDLLEPNWWRNGFPPSGPPPKRGEILSSVRNSFLKTMKLWKAGNYSPHSKLEFPKQPTWRTASLALPIRVGYCLPSFRFLRNKLRNQLSECGLNLSEIDSWLKDVQAVANHLPLSAAGPFDDVPHTHWGAKAVEELRWFGLLKGYPGGKFEGASRK